MVLNKFVRDCHSSSQIPKVGTQERLKLASQIATDVEGGKREARDREAGPEPRIITSKILEWGGVAGVGEVAGAVVGDPVEDREEGELIWVWVWLPPWQRLHTLRGCVSSDIVCQIGMSPF